MKLTTLLGHLHVAESLLVKSISHHENVHILRGRAEVTFEDDKENPSIGYIILTLTGYVNKYSAVYEVGDSRLHFKSLSFHVEAL